jgi:ATP-binding cassette, subfamily B, multidrug efflux pump
MKVLRDLSWFFKEERKAYGIGILFLIMVAILELIPPKIIGTIVDEIQTNTLTQASLVKWSAILLLIGFTLYAFRYVWRIMIFGASMRLARRLRKELYEHFTKMSPSFYQKHRTGDLMAHATNDLQAVQQTAGAGILTLVDLLALGSLVLITMATTISWELTVVSLLPMPIMALATKYYGTLLHKRFHLAQEAFSSLNDKVQESMTGVKVIKSFGQEEQDIEQFNSTSMEVVHKNMRVARIDALFDPTIFFMVGLSYIIALSYGSHLVLTDQLTIGGLITFTTYLGLLTWPMLAFGWLFNIMQRGRASYDRVRRLLAISSDVVDREDAKDELQSGDIEYALSSFSYDGKKEDLRNIHFTLGEGETIGIVGKTGAGKTTLLKLLFREFDHYNGEIAIHRTNIKDVTMKALRQKIGYVPQDNFLFSTTIADNIAFGKPKATYEEIIQAAKIANIHEDILQFPEGYETVVGERGVSLSGGQKQRISIARAILTNPDILILDDCLSAVDAKTEESILQAMKRERKGKTTMITSHRLSAISHAELIIVLENGEIAERGVHTELMEQDGWYKEMYESQLLEDIVEKGGK